MINRAGSIIYTIKDDTIYYLLVKQRESGNWSLPKGRLNKEEDILDGAIRETYEETGLILDKEQYNGTKSHKKCKYFYIMVNPLLFNIKLKPKDRREISKIAWFKSRDKKLSKRNTNKGVRYFLKLN